MIFVKNYKVVKKNAGFTLVELVLILVLLGILGAVAVPKYFDLQDEAQQKAARLAVAEAQSRIEARFSELILNGETCSKAVETVSKLTDLDDSEDEEKARFGDYSLTPVKLPGEITPMTVTVVDGTTETEVSFGTGEKPKLVLPTCADSKETIVADNVAEAIWKIINQDSELQSGCSEDNGRCTSRYGDNQFTQKIQEALKKVEGLTEDESDISGKLWAAEITNGNLRVVVTTLTQEDANDMYDGEHDKLSKAVDATIYSSKTQKVDAVKFTLLFEKTTHKAYVDTGNMPDGYK